MINFEALFKISYGLYIVCSGDKNHGNGFVSNTVFQVTAEPAQFAICCNKNNYTSESFILSAGNPNVWIDKIDPNWTGTIPMTVFYKNKNKIYFHEGDYETYDIHLVVMYWYIEPFIYIYVYKTISQTIYTYIHDTM